MKILGDQTKLKPESERKKIRGLNIRKFNEFEIRLKSQLQQHSARQFAAWSLNLAKKARDTEV